MEEKDLDKKNTRIIMEAFVSLFVRNSTVKEVGLPIGECFIWTDDYRFCGRICRKQSCYIVPGSRGVHAMKSIAKTNIATDDRSRMDRYRYLYRNDDYCNRQYEFKGWIYIITKIFYSVLNVLLKSKNDRLKRVFVIWIGFIEGLKI